MKRKVFFLLEKLEIKRSERIAISILFLLLLGLSGILGFQSRDANYDEKEYKELEKIFTEKSEQLEREQDLIMARYEPTRDVPVSMSVRGKGESKLNLPDTTDEAKQENQPSEIKVVNINTATNERLQELPGVGPAYAKRIITWRDENGAFTSKDQLLEIKGIGDKRLAKIKPLITLQE